MIRILLSALISQLLLLGTGVAILQIMAFQYRLNIRQILPWAWGVGIGFIYLTGYTCLKTGLGTGTWLMTTLLLSGILAAVALRIRSKAQESKPSNRISLTWYDILILLAIVIKITLVSYILFNNPMIDSDAANPNRWMGLGKYIHGTDELPVIRDRFGPSLLPLWVSLFCPRWHDSMVSLPWLSTYIAFIGIAFVTSRKITKNTTTAFAIAYIYSAIPLAAVHVIRPGYSDFLLAYMLLFSFSPLILALIAKAGLTYMQWFIIGCGCIMCTLTKNEGIAWAAVVVGFTIGYWCRKTLALAWKTILIGHAGLAAIGYLIYFVSSDYLFTHVFNNAGGHLKYVFKKTVDFRAVSIFFHNVFTDGSFNLLWWLAAMAAVSLLVGKSSREAKITAVYVSCFFLILFYLSSFTGNVTSTIAGGNMGRFLLQISGTTLPLLALFAKEFLISKKTSVGIGG